MGALRFMPMAPWPRADSARPRAEGSGASWRAFAVVAALPALLGAVLVWAVLVESPRFLFTKRKYPEVCGCAAAREQERCATCQAAQTIDCLRIIAGPRGEVDIGALDAADDDSEARPSLPAERAPA